MIPRWRQAAAVLAVTGIVAVIAPLQDVTAYQAHAATGASTAPGPVTKTKTVTRVSLNADGTEDTADAQRKTVSVTVSQTQDLFGLQNVNVSWSGAQPTGAVVPDANSIVALQQEYPMAILECRGVDDPSKPAAAQISPKTCWTHGAEARYAGVPSQPYQVWNQDRYATAADRGAIVGRPSPAPADCPLNSDEHWVPFIAADGTTYPYGNDGCAGTPPEDYEVDSAHQLVPPNATFAATSVDGEGAVKFDVWSSQENASLGCTATVACTLVAIPIMGLSCDPAGKSAVLAGQTVPSVPQFAAKNCLASGVYAPGETRSGNQPSSAVQGLYWWSPSNWRNRISFALGFAPLSQSCSLTATGTPVTIYGTELMDEAMQQWAPHFCSDPKLFRLTHTRTSEQLAQTLMSNPFNGVNAALASVPPSAGFATPTVTAPVALTGFAISFNIDDANGHEVTTLRLDARLLAKLLTESYLGSQSLAANSYPFQAKNPVNIMRDPEFQALNPGIVNPLSAGTAALIAIEANSDVTYALSSYINADPEARAWLNGEPDPWGMVVNPNYKGLALPVERWPLLDETVPKTNFGTEFQCNLTAPTPWLSLIASPVPDLITSAQDVQFASPPAKSSCGAAGGGQTGGTVYYQWAASGRQSPSTRFTIGITALGDATRSGLNIAQLESQAYIPNAKAKFTDGSGRIFVSPTADSLENAAKLLTANPATSTWVIPYAKLRHDPSGQGAYPGAMLVYAAVPTKGLSQTLAKDYSEYLDFAAGPGQKSGIGDSLLPPGYLPLTKANGLGVMADYTRAAAVDVLAQNGIVPNLSGKNPPPPTTTTSAAATTPSAPTTTPPHQVATPAPSVVLTSPSSSTTTSGPPAGPPATSATTSASPTSSLAAEQVPTPGLGIGSIDVLLPLLLGLGLFSGVVAGGLLLRPSMPGRSLRPRRRR